MYEPLEKSKENILVVGDTIVDSYTETEMIGGQTKTPTISVKYIDKNYVGGAGIAKHIASAGASVTFATVLGDDNLRKYVEKDIKKNTIKLKKIIDKSRPTINKNVITNGAYKLLKLDYIDNRAINDNTLNKLIGEINTFSGDAVIFSDFRHGIFNSNSIPYLIKSIKKNILKVADSQVASG